MLIQFLHPGRQPDHRGPGPKPWNEGQHRRSFMKLPGAYCIDTASAPEQSPGLLFWGEWESRADVRLIGPGAAHALYVPIYPVFPGTPGLQNTDPFVFDGPFLYCCCKQLRDDGTATYLRNLERGDVILFGSQVAGRFLLDTVFVIRESQLFDSARGPKELKGRLADSFIEATLKPLANPGRGRCETGCGPGEYRLYWGATPGARVDGMFSYAPAKLADDPVNSFERPSLENLEFIENGMNMGFRNCYCPERQGWEIVTRVVTERGLTLGTSFQLPQKAPGPENTNT